MIYSVWSLLRDTTAAVCRESISECWRISAALKLKKHGEFRAKLALFLQRKDNESSLVYTQSVLPCSVQRKCSHPHIASPDLFLFRFHFQMSLSASTITGTKYRFVVFKLIHQECQLKKKKDTLRLTC